MVQNSLGEFKPRFEGCEKKLEINFCGNDLRDISRKKWGAVLRKINCVILSCSQNKFFDSYILNESSLFIYPEKLMLKTCGTTSLLLCLPSLLKLTALNGSYIDVFQFSRSNYFPDSQPFPHKNFDSEIKYLNRFFDGDAFIIGPVDGSRLNIYIADKKKNPLRKREQTLELVMYDLDTKKLTKFHQKAGLLSDVYNGESATNQSGISLLFPIAEIQSFLFSPCGYSCNALMGPYYFTIHVTPEIDCSFASFETNIPLRSCTNLIRDVVRLFNPASFSAFLFQVNDARGDAPSFWNIENFMRTCSSHTDVEACHQILYSNFRQLVDSNKKRKEQFVYKSSLSFCGNDETVQNDFDFSRVSCASLSAMKSLIFDFLKDKFYIKKYNKSVPLQKKSDFGFLIRDLISENEADEGFVVLDVDAVVRVLYEWAQAYPKIRPSFSLNYYSNPLFLLSLSCFGCGFSCFRTEHVNMLLNLGVDCNFMTVSNLWLSTEQLDKIIMKGVRCFTVDSADNVERLTKTKSFARVSGEIRLVLNINPGGSKETFSQKIETAATAVSKAQSSGLSVTEFAFSSLPKNPESAFRLFSAILCMIVNRFGFPHRNLLLNLGLETHNSTYSHNCYVVRFFERAMKSAILEELNLSVSLKVEFTQFLVKPILTNVVNIISVRKDKCDAAQTADGFYSLKKKVKMNYFVDDGIYQNFLFVKNKQSPPEVVPKQRKTSKKRTKRKRNSRKTKKNSLFETVIWGRTCDNIDCIVESAQLPRLDSNDWLYFRKMDADSMNTMSDFNGFIDLKNTIYIMAGE